MIISVTDATCGPLLLYNFDVKHKQAIEWNTFSHFKVNNIWSKTLDCVKEMSNVMVDHWLPCWQLLHVDAPLMKNKNLMIACLWKRLFFVLLDFWRSSSLIQSPLKAWVAGFCWAWTFFSLIFQARYLPFPTFATGSKAHLDDVEAIHFGLAYLLSLAQDFMPS